jgi:hypothetical protein
MIFSFDVQPAHQGDCFLIHYGSKEDPGLVLIDGGPSQVYKPVLKPRLAEIKKARQLKTADPLPIDLMMVSHIDDDHIKGILELTNELVVAKNEKKPLPLKIRSLWHNTFDNIIGNKPDELLAAVTASFGAAALSGEPDTEGLDSSVAMVLASVGQGFRLTDDARRLQLRINPEFEGKLVMAKEDGKPIVMAKGLKFTVVGPMPTELIALQKDYDTYLKKHPEEQKSESALAAFTDESVANLSSLVLLAELENKKMLLTGDARGDKILEGLEMVGLLKKNDTMHVDILKVPHHGSSRNLDPIFFRRLTADHYVFSGNGEFGNPERETLQMLLDERGNDEITMHFTYPIEEIDVEREKDWIKEQQKEVKRKQKDPEKTVRPDWSAAEHSLGAFFKAQENFAKKISIVEAKKPYVINLIDEL